MYALTQINPIIMINLLKNRRKRLCGAFRQIVRL